MIRKCRDILLLDHEAAAFRAGVIGDCIVIAMRRPSAEEVDIDLAWYILYPRNQEEQIGASVGNQWHA